MLPKIPSHHREIEQRKREFTRLIFFLRSCVGIVRASKGHEGTRKEEKTRLRLRQLEITWKQRKLTYGNSVDRDERADKAGKARAYVDLGRIYEFALYRISYRILVLLTVATLLLLYLLMNVIVTQIEFLQLRRSTES